MQGTRYHLRKQQFGCMTRRHKTRLVAVHAVACRDILMTVAFKATWKLDPEHVVSKRSELERRSGRLSLSESGSGTSDRNRARRFMVLVKGWSVIGSRLRSGEVD